MEKSELSDGEKFLDVLARGGYQIRGTQVFTSQGELIGLTGREERTDMPGRFYVTGLYSRDDVNEVEGLRGCCMSTNIGFYEDLRGDEIQGALTSLIRRKRSK